ncbi:MAG: hypothetical protein LBN42_04455 [Oscillospiraceae bacterium]|nr:hypothetical protein [Oscillospiraceae bacterium]
MELRDKNFEELKRFLRRPSVLTKRCGELENDIYGLTVIRDTIRKSSMDKSPPTELRLIKHRKGAGALRFAEKRLRNAETVLAETTTLLHEAEGAVSRLLAELPPELRTIMEHKYIKLLDWEDVATATFFSVRSLHSRHNTAMNYLYQLYDPFR